MSLIVFTARLGCRDRDVLNVTRQGGVSTFAPSWQLLRPFLDLRRASGITPEQWADYERAYVDEMRESYRRERAAWDALMARERVCLVCFCSFGEQETGGGAPLQCHRVVLAEKILVPLGATYRGELARADELRDGAGVEQLTLGGRR